MSEKKLRRVLTSIAVTVSLGLTATATGNASEGTRRRLPERLRVVEAVETPLSAFGIWSLLNQIWEKSGARIDPNGAPIDPPLDPDGER